MEIQKNSRQMPKEEQVVSNKSYCDLIYSWFQCESVVVDGEQRRVAKEKVKYSEMAAVLGMDRRTVSTYVKKMLQMGLFEIAANGDYKVNALESKAAMLVPFKTLRQIMYSLHKNSVNIFIYLLNRYIANGETGYYVTYYSLKKYIGIAVSTTSNNVIISDILNTLQLLGLVEYEIQQTGEKKLNIYIKKVTNVLKS